MASKEERGWKPPLLVTSARHGLRTAIRGVGLFISICALTFWRSAVTALDSRFLLREVASAALRPLTLTQRLSLAVL